ncbi:unnamed protein product, partial [Polarella glacialis]
QATTPHESEWDAGEIVPGLWVGGLSAAENEDELIRRCISSVVTVGTRLQPQVSWTSVKSQSIANKRYDIEDHPHADLLQIIPSAIRAIDKVMKGRSKKESDARTGVLVHCASGMSRSVAVCIAWLMLRCKMSLDDAHEMVKAGRPVARPNFGFMQSLRLLEERKDVRLAQDKWTRSNK